MSALTDEQWDELRELVEGYTTLREGMTKDEANAYWARFFYEGRNKARSELADREARLAAALAALEWYADPSSPIENDGGAKARATLATLAAGQPSRQGEATP